MIEIDKEKALLYGTTVVSVAALFFSLNAQRRLGYLEFDVVDKHENVMQLTGQNAQRINALENPEYSPTFEGERGHFE